MWAAAWASETRERRAGCCGPLLGVGGTRGAIADCELRRGANGRATAPSRLLALNGCGRAPKVKNRGCTSLSAAEIGRRSRLIREKIIGRGLHGFGPSIAIQRSFLRTRMFALLHKPAGQHSRRVLFEPGIQQLTDLFAEIGGVIQARKLVALQGVAGCGEQELPGRLSFVVQGSSEGKHGNHSNITRRFNGTKYVRNVEKCARF